ncbi:MAG TPA: hypothetical protein VF165_11030 [Nocardioidaceae bacterium]
MSDARPGDEARRLRGEGELTAELITAAQEAQEPLSQQEIDSILGVDPE